MIEFHYSHGLIGYRTFKNYLNESPHLPQTEIFISENEEKENYKFEPNLEPEIIYPWKNITRKYGEIKKEIRSQLEGINLYGILNECPPLENYSEAKSLYKNIDYEDSIKHTYKYGFLKMIREQNYLK